MHEKQHSLRNKMAIIIGSVDIILLGQRELDREMIEDLDRIRRSAHDALSMVDACGDRGEDGG